MDITEITHLAVRERSPRTSMSLASPSSPGASPSGANFFGSPPTAGWMSMVLRNESEPHTVLSPPSGDPAREVTTRSSFNETSPPLQRRSSLELGLSRFQRSFKRYSAFD